MSLYLGLDVSTSITGYSIMRDDGSTTPVIEGHIDLRKIEGMIQKAQAVQRELESVFFEYPEIEVVGIESPALAFGAGKSSAMTIAKLVGFNGMVQLLVSQIGGIIPEMIMPSSARKKAGIKIVRSGVKAKEQVMQHALAHWSFDPDLKRTGRIKDYEYDKIDARVIALAMISLKKTA